MVLIRPAFASPRLEAFLCALDNGDVDGLRRLLLEGPPPSEPATHTGGTLLHAALFSGHAAPEMIRLLLDAGVDAACRDSSGTPYDWAVECGMLSIVRLLGPDPTHLLTDALWLRISAIVLGDDESYGVYLRPNRTPPMITFGQHRPIRDMGGGSCTVNQALEPGYWWWFERAHATWAHPFVERLGRGERVTIAEFEGAHVRIYNRPLVVQRAEEAR